VVGDAPEFETNRPRFERERLESPRRQVRPEGCLGAREVFVGTMLAM